jgi:hypothetical protein
VAAFVCTACGTQFPQSHEPPPACPICADERQFVPASGQGWTTLEQLRRSHSNTFRQVEEKLLGIRTVPHFGIGQQALLLLSEAGNVLWDCLTLIDEATVTLVKALGGIRAIAISHPHYYSAMTAWAAAFDAPVHLHAADRSWVVRPDERLVFWDGETAELQPGLTLVRCGGHFAGGTVLHWAGGADGRGALLSGDILQVVEDRRHVSFMRSYPNLIPLSAAAVRRIVGKMGGLEFERVYGAFWGRVIAEDGKSAVRRSAERYIAAVGGRGPADRER